ncbi:glycosyltransferase family A protein [Saccharolobus caldissimus]|uniref:Glycosyltransferase 2-like domain-containing protein n=1 Tax=Saccharolobus caldissimus TaxID=1702097 RepID=A0AAQ4CVN2_9CREN|nr:glycosyltransferase family A protein [Saccharolobus caldissimus]BDB99863.1 hypothetical protein SACC_28800 [Saccharolobus caldissimus]
MNEIVVHTLDEYGIINIYTDDETLGGKLSLGILKSSGDVILFLDDDDLFSKNKIEHVLSMFTKYDIGFYQNLQEKFRDKIPEKYNFNLIDNNENYSFLYYKSIDSRKIGTLIFKYKVGFNTSSIVIKRDLAMKCVDLMKNVRISVDTFLFFCSIIYGFPIMIDFKKLTYYRIPAIKNNLTPNIEAFKKYYEDSLYFMQIFPYKFLKDIIEISIIQREFIYNLISGQKVKSNIFSNILKFLKILIKYPNKWNFFMISLLLISILSQKKGKDIYLKTIYSNSTLI